MDEIYLAERLSALSHVTRLRALKELLAAPAGLPAGKLAGRLNVRQNSLSPHLASLSRNSLIIGAREGREVIYTARADYMNLLMQHLQNSLSAPSAKV